MQFFTHFPVFSSSIVPAAQVHPGIQTSGHTLGFGLAQFIVPAQGRHLVNTFPLGHRFAAVQG